MISLLVSSRPRIGPRTTHRTSLPKCVLTPDGSNKAEEVKVGACDRTIHVSAAYGHELFVDLPVLCLVLGALRGFPRDAQYIAAAGTPCQHETDGS